MEFSNFHFKILKDSTKPPLSSTRQFHSFHTDSHSRPRRRRAETFYSSPIDSRAMSPSPSRGLIPLSLVSTSNVDIPLPLQQQLKSTSNQRKALASILQSTNENIKFHSNSKIESSTTSIKSFKSFNSCKSSKSSLKLNESKDNLKTMNIKEYTFGNNSRKENNYVNLYYKQRSFRGKIKGNEEVLEFIKGIKEVKEGGEVNTKTNELTNLQDFESDEVERRYLKITDNLDKIARNIEIAIHGGKV